MESRLEKNLRRKKANKKRKLKFIAIFCLFIFLLFAIGMVNQRIVDLDCMENPTIIRINVDSKTVEWFGQVYEFDFKKVKDY